jgi:hypothetical protein
VIRCDRVARGRYSVTVREAVGIVALPSLQLVVEPKIPAPRFRYLLQRSPAFPRLDDHQTAAVESAELWDLVAAWYVTALEPPVFRQAVDGERLTRDPQLNSSNSRRLPSSAVWHAGCSHGSGPISASSRTPLG